MKAKNKKCNSQDFPTAVGRALRRAGLAARKTARMYGTPIYVLRAGDRVHFSGSVHELVLGHG
jgi:hypothetical protein